MHERLSLERAAGILMAGGVMACPAEAVWGLSCDPFNQAAVERLFAIKRRSPDKGLILVTGLCAQAAPWLARLPSERRAAVEASWPGPVTWILPDPDQQFPDWIRGAHDRVAIRVTAHPPLAALCQQVGGWLVSTSANRSGEAPLETAEAIAQVLGEEIDGILDADTGGRDRPSDILDALSGQRLR